MSSLSAVAKKAGVSLATASIVLNPGKQACRVSEGCQLRVRDAAEKLGYVPNYHAQSMKRGKAGVLALALDLGFHQRHFPTHSELGSTYFGRIIGGVELHTRKLGYQLTIVGPDERQRAPDRAMLGIRQRRFDGMIVPGTVIRTDLTGFLKDAPLAPIVVVEYAGQTDLPVVDWDEKAGVDLALQHLAELGHRELLWLGPPVPANDEHKSSREQVFLEAVRKAGLKAEVCRFAPLSEEDELNRQGNTANAAEAALGKFLKAQPRKFTAVVSYNDETGIGACGALQQAGLRIPEDVSVTGFDDAEAALCIPRLTSISHKLGEMGLKAAEWVVEMVENPELIQARRGKRELLKPDLVIRKSTGAMRSTSV